MENEASELRPPLWRLVWENVRRDDIPLRAAALSFATLASLLPLIVIVLALLSGPAFSAQRERMLDQVAAALSPAPLSSAPEAAPEPPGPAAGKARTETRQDARKPLKDKFRAALDLLSGNLGKIGIFSFLIFFYIAGWLFQTVESTFNAIWKVRVGRSILMKVTLTTAFLFWGPVLVALTLALTSRAPDWPFFSHYLLPLLLSGLAFTAFYLIMPHARVRFRAALAGGITGAVLWEISKIAFLWYVGHAMELSKIYGSFGLIPLVFTWVYLSWMVVLAGAELAYIIQHHRLIVEQWEARQRAAQGHVAPREAERIRPLAFSAAAEIARRYLAGDGAGGVRFSELTETLGAEPGVLSRALERLVSGGILLRVTDGEQPAEHAEDSRFVPAQDPARCGLDRVLRASRSPKPAWSDHPAHQTAGDLLDRLERENESALARISLAEWAAPPGHATSPAEG